MPLENVSATKQRMPVSGVWMTFWQTWNGEAPRDWAGVSDNDVQQAGLKNV